MRNLFLLFVLAAALVSCEGTKTDKANDAEATTFNVFDMNEQVADLVDQQIVISGTVDHVCKHGGGKMYLFDPVNEDSRIKIVAGESGDFIADEMMGMNVTVTGVVEELRVDEGYLANMDAELQAEMDAAGEEIGDVDPAKEVDGSKVGDREAKMRSFEAQKGQIDGLRLELEESGDDHLSFYSIVATTYTIDGEGVLPDGADGSCKEENEETGNADAEEAEHTHEEGEDHEGHNHE